MSSDKEPEMTTVTVLTQRSSDGGKFCFGGYEDGSLNRVIDSLLGTRQLIPAKFRKAARCEIRADQFYDSSYVEIEITYRRPANAQEIAERAKRREQDAEVEAARERHTYDALKAKYG